MRKSSSAQAPSNDVVDIASVRDGRDRHSLRHVIDVVDSAVVAPADAVDAWVSHEVLAALGARVLRKRVDLLVKGLERLVRQSV